ncbi:type II toxin-antitoxin system VapC family toxin [Rhizobium tumorigenes]|uniref:type II toxin-antitoxin system VapC family toxin n=1 Tax=Rhizobium tumorigenes TaxID=2041385 RepID=UPI00241C6044|nr:type II toxin-antitoxin system VapC family toxin [Rhizobium tumorigenes]WFS00457.1 type II toxin-antitoxin system VapC family toxin [Rhizobium tumorigenes]
MIVVDASVVVKWFIDEEYHLEALELTKMPKKLKAPDIVLTEVAHVLRRKVRMNIISNSQAADALTTLKSTFKNATPSIALIDVAFELSTMMDHSVYDTMYLACALEEKDDVLVTADRKFAAKAIAAGFDDKIRILGAASAETSLRQENGHG